MNTLIFICTLLATLLVVFWLFLFLRYSKKYSKIIEGIDGKIFTMKDLYFIGLGMIDMYEHSSRKKITTSDKAITQCKKLAEAFGRDNGELYYYVTSAAKLSLIMTFLPIGLLLAALMKSAVGFLAGALLVIVFPYGVQSGINTAIANKKDAIVSEFPKMVSKMTLLVNAGMLLRRAWDEVAESDPDATEGLYAEMRTVSRDILEGMTIEQAMDEFATRCGVKEIRKFASIYVQAVKRGASESIESMKIMADEAWEQKKQYSKQKGEAAASKLLIPNMIMFMGILAVVVIPMIASMLGSFNA